MAELKAFPKLPKHVAIIMDGNNRWAKAHRLPSLAGHKKGVDAVRAVVDGCLRYGVESLTLFAFSSENWARPADEVSGLMELFMLALKREVKKLHQNNIRLNIIGERTRFSTSLQQKIADAEALTQNNTGLVLNVAANYGGRWDITQAARRLASEVEAGTLAAKDISEQMLGGLLSMSDQPAPDLCIRTAGEQRISNFLLWQCAYAEFYFTSTYWPDFDLGELEKAFDSYCSRERRFGKTSEQVEAEKQNA